MAKKLPSTPCINICKINSEDGHCLGCFRTLDEIAMWAQLNDADKALIYKEINDRKICNSDISREIKL